MSDTFPDYTAHFTENNGEHPRKRRRPWHSAHRPAYIAAVELRAAPARDSLVPPPSDAAQRNQFASFTRPEGHAGIGLDCPIRAGPGGYERCGWRPDDGTKGFPNLTRVRDHVSRHGMLCPDCGRTFQRHRHFKEHLRSKPCNGMYAFEGQSKYPLGQLPEEIDDFFESFDRKGPSLSPADAWMRAYKCLHPDWEFDSHPLPSAFYRQNADREKTMLSQPRPRPLVMPDQAAVAGAAGEPRPSKQAPAPFFDHAPGPATQIRSEDSMEILPVNNNGKAPLPAAQGQLRSYDSTSRERPLSQQTNILELIADMADPNWEAMMNNMPESPSYSNDSMHSPDTIEHFNPTNLPPQWSPSLAMDSDLQANWPAVEQNSDPQRTSSIPIEATHNASGSTSADAHNTLQGQDGPSFVQGNMPVRAAASICASTKDMPLTSDMEGNSQYLTNGLQATMASQFPQQQNEKLPQPPAAHQRDHPDQPDTSMADMPITSVSTDESARAAIVDYFSAEIDTLNIQIGTLRMHGQAIQSHTKNCHRDLIVHPETQHDMTRRKYVDTMVQMFLESRFQLF